MLLQGRRRGRCLYPPYPEQNLNAFAGGRCATNNNVEQRFMTLPGGADHQVARYFAEAAYVGAQFHGWQSQRNAHTIQAEIEAALKTILQEEVKITGSGRTDTGVHACQQFFHFDTRRQFSNDRLRYKLNALLDKDIAIKKICRVTPDAHARYSAVKRSYIYKICPYKDPFARGQSYQLYKKLDTDKMNEAAGTLLGENDFTSYSKVKTSVNNFFCNVFEAKWVERKETGILEFHISANRFLRGMVRALVGTLLQVGENKITAREFEQILAVKDRKKAGRSVPAEGLFLSKVEYPEEIFIK